VASSVSRRLALAGLACVAVGQLWGFVLPVNKRLWTSSFVVLTAGFSLLLLALCYELLEVRRERWSWLGQPFVVFGTNALVVFIASEELTGWMNRLGWRPWLYGHVFSLASFRVGSLLYGLAFVVLWWAVCAALWRRRIFIKV
jgi:predicted acyltransferase